MHRLAGLFAAFAILCGSTCRRRAGPGQEPHRVRRGFDEERARRHRRRLYRQDRRQGRRQLCRKLGAGQADRTGRAGGYLHVRRHRLDGLRDRQEEHQRADPGQSARQQHRADRAEGFQDRQRDDRTRASISPSSPATARSPPATSRRFRSANTPRRRWRSSARGRPPSRNSRWPKTCAPR